MSRIVHLKIKIKSLAAEAQIIRAEERKAKRHRNWLLHHDSASDAYTQASTSFWSLRHHRTGVVRNEARISQLAYGFLRGTPYAEMEQKTDDPPDFDTVKKMADRFNGHSSLSRSDGHWILWKESAEAHLKRPTQAVAA